MGDGFYGHLNGKYDQNQYQENMKIDHITFVSFKGTVLQSIEWKIWSKLFPRKYEN